MSQIEIFNLIQVRDIFKGKELRMLINPQWQEEGQVISDFGFGRRRQENEEFVKKFEYVYCLKQYRIKSNDIKVLKCYPEDWKVFVVDGEDAEMISSLEEEPRYGDIEGMIGGSDRNPKSLIDRVKREFDFNYRTLNLDKDK